MAAMNGPVIFMTTSLRTTKVNQKLFSNDLVLLYAYFYNVLMLHSSTSMDTCAK